jgi:hypothetical protein
VHQWKQRLTPYATNFSGIQVTETDLGGGSDSCWFNGSFYGYWDYLTGGTWDVGANNWWGVAPGPLYDYVGWFDNAVLYYRNQGRAPCNNVMNQRMDVVGGCTGYTTNVLKAYIGVITVKSERDGKSAERVWP